MSKLFRCHAELVEASCFKIDNASYLDKMLRQAQHDR